MKNSIPQLCWGRMEWDRTFWARGYYVSTVGNVTEDAIKKYIKEQEEEAKREETGK